jgi:olfactory receptor
MHIFVALHITKFKDVEITNFFCDPSQVLSLSCTDTLIINILRYFGSTVYGLLPISGILFSYYKILSTILRIPSSKGMDKALSTCGSHLSVVCIYPGTGLAVYVGSTISPSPRNSAEACSVIYAVATLLLNPFIYSLRNRDIKTAVRRLWNGLV